MGYGGYTIEEIEDAIISTLSGFSPAASAARDWLARIPSPIAAANAAARRQHRSTVRGAAGRDRKAKGFSKRVVMVGPLRKCGLVRGEVSARGPAQISGIGSLGSMSWPSQLAWPFS